MSKVDDYMSTSICSTSPGEQAMEISQNRKNATNLVGINELIGTLYVNEKNYTEASKYLEKAIKVVENVR